MEVINNEEDSDDEVEIIESFIETTMTWYSEKTSVLVLLFMY